MSKWKSAEAVAREAKQQERLRKQRRKEKLQLVGVISLMVITFAAYLAWAFTRIEKHKGHDHQRYRHGRSAQTNLAPANLSPEKSTPSERHE